MADKTYKIRSSKPTEIRTRAGVVRIEAGEVALVDQATYDGLMRKKEATGTEHVTDDTPVDVDYVDIKAQINATQPPPAKARFRGDLGKILSGKPGAASAAEANAEMRAAMKNVTPKGE